MKKLFSVLCALMLVLSSASMFVFADNEKSAKEIRGLMVNSRENTDFPSAANLSAKALRREISAVIDYALSAGYNAIFFEARPDGGALYSSLFPTSQYLVEKQGAFTFFDPLREMIKSAKKSGISVYAVIDPYSLGTDADLLANSHPARNAKSSALRLQDKSIILDPENDETIRINARDIEIISKKYDLSGVILSNLMPTDNADAAVSLLENISAAADGRLGIGAFLPDEALEKHPEIIDLLDIAVPSIDAVTGFDDVNFTDRLFKWHEALDGKELIPYIDAASLSESAEEYSAQILTLENSNLGGFVVSDYSYLKNDENFAGSLIASMVNISDTEVYEPEYDPPQELTITRPSSKLTTTYSAYFIMGTSDPEQSLTMNWKAVDRQTSNGVFGVFVDLAFGTNTFTFRQGNKSETVTIVRSSGGGSAATTTKVTSMSPKFSALAYNGDKIAISCVAPAGTTVTASLNGTTIIMKQKAIASAGIPATFTAEMPVSGADNGAVIDLGPITYKIVESSSEFTSNGSVFAAGEDSRPMAVVNSSSASLFYDEAAKAGNFKSIYKSGVTDYILGSAGEYYELSSGFISKEFVDVMEMNYPVSTSVSEIAVSHDEKAERFILKGANGLPYVFTDNDDGSVEITFYGISLPEKIDTTSEIFSFIEWNDNGDSTVTALFKPKNKIWALDVFPSEEGTIIYAKRTPKLSDTVGKPLSGISVVLDPGHGGNDSGAVSTVNTKESDLNFSNATMLKYRLEQLGAEVTLTRTSTDDNKTLYERVAVGQEILPDFFISLHHNSIVEYADGYKHEGVEAYYYEDFGKDIASSVVAHISQANYDRAYRHYSWGYYVVAKNRFAPSILCEIGFVPNPIESRYISDNIEIYKTANAISTAIMEVISNAND